jgi:hypothetical protein
MKKLTSLLLAGFAFTILGSTLFLYQNCSKPIQDMGDVTGTSTDPTDCNFNGQNVQSGFPVTAYLTSTVPAGQTCDGQTRMCNNGVLGAPLNYLYSSCSPLGAGGSGFVSMQMYVTVNGQRLTTTQEVPYGANYDVVIDGSNDPTYFQTFANTAAGAIFFDDQNIADVTSYRCLTPACNASLNAGFVVSGNMMAQHNVNRDAAIIKFGLRQHIALKPSLATPNAPGNYMEYIFKTASPVGSGTTDVIRWLSSDLAGSYRVFTQSLSNTWFYEQYLNVFTDAVTPVTFCAEYVGQNQAQYPGLIPSCYSAITTPSTRCMNGASPNLANFNIHYSATTRGLVANGTSLYSSPNSSVLGATVPCPNLTYSQLFILKNNVVYPQSFQFYTP